jgi:AcrR family transcriptional regulator
VRILKREGTRGVTTNRIAEVAGVSIGSVYQYFPDKHAIFEALHDRHSDEVGRLIDATVIAHAAAPFEEMVRALVTALVEAHGEDPELHALLSSEVPKRGGGNAFVVRLRDAFRLALEARLRRSPRDIERMLFVLPHLVDALTHGAAVQRPASISKTAATEEAVRVVISYVRSRH